MSICPFALTHLLWFDTLYKEGLCNQTRILLLQGEARREMKKQKKGCLTGALIFFAVLTVLLIIFIIWLFSEDDYDYYDDYDEYYGYYADDESLSYTDQIETQSGESGQALFSSLPVGAVRQPQVTLKGNGEDTVTVLVYMNGSDLESSDGSATADLKEMVCAGNSDKVNLIVQTMGTKKWQKTYGISSKQSQIYSVDGSGLTLLRNDLGQLDCTDGDTLRDFIKWGVKNYPADRYILLFWDHGGGPVYGFGYDEYRSDDATLTIDEMEKALSSAGVYFDLIGFDACIMSSVEVCCAFYDYCDYMVLSEDFESGIGWYYTGWLRSLYANSSIPTIELGKKIVDEMISVNQTSADGDNGILALVDEGAMKVLYSTWVDFAYANERTLLGKNYSRKLTPRGRVLPLLTARSSRMGWLFGEDDEASLSEYYITDIMSLASTLNTDEAAALEAAVSQALVYVNSTSGDRGLTGISVTLPYGDDEFYESLKTVFTNCGIDGEYVKWLEKFCDAEGRGDYYSYNRWDDNWTGWDSYEDDYDWSEWDHYHDSGSFWDYLWDDYEWENEYGRRYDDRRSDWW